MRVGVAPPEHLQNVPERRAFERRHDADLARQRWQRPLACTIEQAFGVELLLQLIEGELQRAQPLRLEVLADDLVFALGIVNAQPAAGDDVQPVFGLEAQIPDRRPEHDALDLRPAVLQREIHVAGVPHAAVRDLAFDPDVAEAALDRVADFRGQLRHGEDAAIERPRRRRGVVAERSVFLERPIEQVAHARGDASGRDASASTSSEERFRRSIAVARAQPRS